MNVNLPGGHSRPWWRCAARRLRLDLHRHRREDSGERTVRMFVRPDQPRLWPVWLSSQATSGGWDVPARARQVPVISRHASHRPCPRHPAVSCGARRLHPRRGRGGAAIPHRHAESRSFNFPDGSEDQDQVTFTVINLGHANTGQMVFPSRRTTRRTPTRRSSTTTVATSATATAARSRSSSRAASPTGRVMNNATFTVSGAEGGEVTVPIVIV